MYWSVNVSVWKYINLKVYQSESVPIRKCTSLYTHILPAEDQFYYFCPNVRSAVETTGLNPLFNGIYKVLKLWKTTFHHMVTLPCDVGYYGMSYHIYKNFSKIKEYKKKQWLSLMLYWDIWKLFLTSIYWWVVTFSMAFLHLFIVGYWRLPINQFLSQKPSK